MKGLGRGLDALLSGNEPAKETQQTLAVTKLQPGKYQPRTHMDQESLARLSESIKNQGLMQPILVRPVGPDNYEIIAGERRWRAARMAGLSEVPVVVREIPDEAALTLSLIENIQREDLNPLEEAAGIQRLIDEFKLTHQAAADAVGRSRAAVTNLLRLLHLTQPVQDMMMSDQIDMGHARALLALGHARQLEVAHEVAQKNLSVRETERLVQRLLAPPKKPVKPRADRDVHRLQEELAEKLGARVAIKTAKGGHGKLIIEYDSFEQLEGIINKL
jgi:ParB family chromosome partitioning protein